MLGKVGKAVLAYHCPTSQRQKGIILTRICLTYISSDCLHASPAFNSGSSTAEYRAKRVYDLYFSFHTTGRLRRKEEGHITLSKQMLPTIIQRLLFDDELSQKVVWHHKPSAKGNTTRTRANALRINLVAARPGSYNGFVKTPALIENWRERLCALNGNQSPSQVCRGMRANLPKRLIC